MYATHRKSTQPALGYIVSILGVDYCQAATAAEASKITKTINKRTDSMSEAKVRELYKLGA